MKRSKQNLKTNFPYILFQEISRFLVHDVLHNNTGSRQRHRRKCAESALTLFYYCSSVTKQKRINQPKNPSTRVNPFQKESENERKEGDVGVMATTLR